MKGLQQMSITYGSEALVRNYKWNRYKRAQTYVYDTIPVSEMLTRKNRKDGMWIDWHLAFAVLHGDMYGKFEEWRVRSRNVVFTRDDGLYAEYRRESDSDEEE